MAILRLLFLLVLTSTFPVVGASVAHAACSTTLSLEEAVAAAPIVFVGRVATLESGRTVAGVRVVSVWKGPDLPERIEVLGGFEGDADARKFSIGGTYIFFPTNRRPPFIADGCTATRLFSGQPLVIPLYLADGAGTSTARQPIVEAGDEEAEAEAAVFGPVIVLFAILLGLAGLSAAFGSLMRRSPVRLHDSSETRPKSKRKVRAVRRDRRRLPRAPRGARR